MADPTTFSSVRQYIGVAVEVTQGTPVTPAVTVPVASFTPEDKNTWLDDRSLRGSMVGLQARVQGVRHSEVSFGGPGYFDTLPYFVANVLGDKVYSGTYTGSGTTTLNSSSVVGATSISTVASIAGSTLIQIGTGVNSEVRLTTGVSGGGPYTLTFTTPLLVAHSGGDTVKPITFPYTSAFSVLNYGNGQPTSLTITDYQGPTASTGTRAYPGICLSDVSMKGTVESGYLDYTAQGMGWPSASAAAVTSSPSAVTGQPAWKATIGLNGTIGAAQILTVNDFEISLRRAIEIKYTAQNSQNPYTVYRGICDVSGRLNAIVSDETFLTYLNSNTQPQLQILLSNGLSGANLLSIQFDIRYAAFSESKINRSKAWVEYDASFDSIANSTNAGWSAGLSPVTVTFQNAITPNSY